MKINQGERGCPFLKHRTALTPRPWAPSCPFCSETHLLGHLPLAPGFLPTFYLPAGAGICPGSPLTRRSWSSRKVCSCGQPGSGVRGLVAGLLIAPSEPCNPTCAFPRWSKLNPGRCYGVKEEPGVRAVEAEQESSRFSISVTLPAPCSVLTFTPVTSQPSQSVRLVSSQCAASSRAMVEEGRGEVLCLV